MSLILQLEIVRQKNQERDMKTVGEKIFSDYPMLE